MRSTSKLAVAPLLDRHIDMLRCPSCEGDLTHDGEGLACGRCSRRYPTVDGILQLVGPSDDGNRPIQAVTEAVRAFYEIHPFPDYEDVDSPQRLEQEAKRGVFARLLNEQIPDEARVLDVGTDEHERPFYVMELLAGVSHHEREAAASRGRGSASARRVAGARGRVREQRAGGAFLPARTDG